MKKQRKYLFTGFCLLVFGITLFSCRKDPQYITGSNAKLAFSQDTVMFDTVFTTIGSCTKRLMVYNPHKETINISKIALAGGSSSQYMINVDGEYAHAVYDKEIEGKDSMYIFVKVRINPSAPSVNDPFFVKDSIIFETNGNYQDIKLVALGQDAHYFLPTHFGNMNYCIIEDEVWENDKPYVIYDFAAIDSAQTLTIKEGCRLHFHKGGGLLVYKGTLNIEGSATNKVIMQSDRLESYFRESPGQWNGIYLSEAQGCIIDNAVIRNATLGIQCDGITGSNAPALQVTNTAFENMSAGAIAGNGTAVIGANLLMNQCHGYAMALMGGQFRFQHVTIGNYASTEEAPSIVLWNAYTTYVEVSKDEYVEQINVVEPTDILIENSIVWGNAGEEIAKGKDVGGTFNWAFNHCLLKTKRDLSSSNFSGCFANEDPLFIDREKYDYKLDTLSPALNKGANLGIPIDIDGNMRSAETPDLGAYEMDY